MHQSGINMEQVKSYNRAMIIKYICEHKTASRVDIASECGLTPAAVTQIISPLIRDEIIVEVGTSGKQKGAGRRKVLLSMNYENIYLYSINIGRVESSIAITDINGDVAAMTHIPTDNKATPEQYLKVIANACVKLSDGVKEPIRNKIKGASVGIPGVVDIENGIAVRAYGVWEQSVLVKQILAKELDMPVIIQNDVNAFARAELLFGDGRYKDNLLIVKWGQGVGGAIVIDGNVYGNKERKTAEIGHMIVDPQGDICSCGKRGCLETRASYKKLNSIIPFELEDFAGAFKKGDEKQKKELEEVISLFALALVNACELAAPEKIILCGPLFKDELVRNKLKQSMILIDPSFKNDRLIFTKLYDKEEYLGPVAEFLHRAVFGMKF